MWYSYREFFPKSQPKRVAGGIKAASKTGAFGKSWWAKRWLAVLESFNIGSRLARGRSYARKGQVLDIDIKPGRVQAKVQGSMPRPYAVTIEVKTLNDKEWAKLIDELNAQAVFAAKLLAGEMPPDIEQVFDRAGLSLFPKRLDDITTACSCPDWSNPCKHVAAVYYLIGEEFDRDPFLLFRLRGIDRAALTERLGHAPAVVDDELAFAPEPLPTEAGAFWREAALPADWCGDVRLPPTTAAVPTRLGAFPFWRGAVPFQEEMLMAYPSAARRGLAAFEAEPPAE